MLKLSHAFSSYRQLVIAELSDSINMELVPKFNAECEDIRREFEIKMLEAQEIKEGAPRDKIIELAQKNKQARILDLNVRKNEFLKSITEQLHSRLQQRIAEYKGETFEEKEQLEGKPLRTVMKAKFPDSSIAKIPKNIHIDYSVFERV